MDKIGKVLEDISFTDLFVDDKDIVLVTINGLSTQYKSIGTYIFIFGNTLDFKNTQYFGHDSIIRNASIK